MRVSKPYLCIATQREDELIATLERVIFLLTITIINFCNVFLLGFHGGVNTGFNMNEATSKYYLVWLNHYLINHRINSSCSRKEKSI
jgi:hypothetical protein